MIFVSKFNKGATIMKKVRKIISLALSLSIVTTLFVGTYGNSVTALELTKQRKISSILLKEMDNVSKKEKVPVAIELEDINLDEIEKKVDEQTGMNMEALETLESHLLDSEELHTASNDELDTMLPEYFADTKEEREYVQSLVNERISAKRKISKQMYTEKNAEKIKKLGIEKNDLEFISSYSPMIIGEMTESEVEDIVANNNVKSIDYNEEPEIEVLSSSTNTYSSFYTTWKSAINVDYTTNSLNLKGEGVTVGVLDCGRIDRISDFNSSNITELNLYNKYSDHATNVTRILSGSNGVVPNAKTYVNFASTSTVNSSIEELVNAGVCVINLSVGWPRKDIFYTSFEKWIDYLICTQGVIFTFATGNDGMHTNIGEPALSYNSITVGGIDTKNTTNKSDDTVSIYTAGANDGNNACAKPDVMAPSVYIYTNGGSGTSYANPMVAGICAQIIEAKPTLAFKPDCVKAILLASCDRKCMESYTSGLTAIEGSGVVNAQIAIEIVSTRRYVNITYNKDNNITQCQHVYLASKPATTKIALAWLVPASTANNTEIPNFKFEVSTSDAYLSTNLPNSSAEMIVSNKFSGQTNFLLTRMDGGTSDVPYAIAWY